MTSPVEIRSFACLIPAGTLITAPVTVAMAMPARIITGIRIRIPAGHNGYTGFQLSSMGVPFMPPGANNYIVGSDEVLDWTLSEQLESGAWGLTGYNTGVYNHTFYVDFTCALVGGDQTTAATLVAGSALSSS